MVSVDPPRFLGRLRDHLKTTEPELWQWFIESMERADEANNTGAEVALLKSAVRLVGGPHQVATAHAALLAAQLGIDEEIELYQEFDSTGRNATVQTFGGKVHIAFSGDLLDLLDEAELRSVLAHELAHIQLWKLDGGDYRVLHELVHRLADESQSDVVAETARRVRLYTEVWADHVSGQLVEKLDVVIASLIKTGSGLRHVDPDAYRRQAEQILAADPSSSAAWTHPETHIRVACLVLRNQDGVDRDDRLAELIEGPEDLDRIDVLGQMRVQAMVARVLHGGLEAMGEAAGRPGVVSYAGNYPDLDITSTDRVDDLELQTAQPSIRHLAGALLVDLALTDDSLDGLSDLAVVSREAERIGVAAEFDKIFAKATNRTPAEAKRLRSNPT